MDLTESLPVCNADNRVVGRATREVIHAQGLLHRAVHVLVFNSRGELFLQRRGHGKDIDPGLWAVSVGGHVALGETPDEAARRELAEELGLTSTLEHIGELPPTPENGWEFVSVYRLVTDETPAWDGEEIIDGRWLTAEQIEGHLAGGDLPLAASFEATHRLASKQRTSVRPR